MTTQTRPLAGYRAYQIGTLTYGQDGGVEAGSYYLTDPPRLEPTAPRSPLCGPREWSPWPGIILLILVVIVAWLSGPASPVG